MIDDPEGGHRFCVEFEGPDWFQIPGRPDARFLAPPVAAPPVAAPGAAPPAGEWPEGWVGIGAITDDAPAPFRRRDE